MMSPLLGHTIILTPSGTLEIILLLIALCVGVWLVIRSIRRRRALVRLQEVALKYAGGDLTMSARVEGPKEVAELSKALSQMAGQLSHRLSTVVAQRNELSAVLSSMVEGVIAIGNDEQVLSLNAAASHILDISAEKAIGQPLQVVTRNADLHHIIRQTLSSQQPQRGEAQLVPAQTDPRLAMSHQQRHLEVQTAILRDQSGQRAGMLLVIQDLTHVRRLENMRRDFVANVSHEVRTPIAAIKAAVETLIEDPDADAQTNQRFLAMIHRQADRMAAIVEDLLSLARIESDPDAIRDQLEALPLATVIHGAIETCSAHAKNKQITVKSQIEDGLRVRMQPALLEQALVNLIDNAIKYSPDETQISVTTTNRDGETVIEVIDQGRGIEPSHLPRIFERFYRTDKARSRSMGGTGLGLSIVKHIAEAHGGRVSVDSIPGTSSVFRIHLPLIGE